MMRLDFRKSFKLHCEKWIGAAMTESRDITVVTKIQGRANGVLNSGNR